MVEEDFLAPKNNRIKWIILSLGFLILILAIISIFVMAQFADAPTSSQINVEQICETLNIDSTDDFCGKPNSQTLASFEVMLRRQYPTDSTSYSELTPTIQDWHVSTWFCQEPVNYDNVCPAPDTCAMESSHNGRYECVYDLSFVADGGGLNIWIDTESGIIRDYEVYLSDS